MSEQNIKSGIETVKKLIDGAITESGRYAITGSSLNTILQSMMDVMDDFYDEYSGGSGSGSGSSGSSGSGSTGITPSPSMPYDELGRGLKIIDDGETRSLNATSDAYLVGDLNSSVLLDDRIPAGESVQNVFEKLFTEIIPYKIPSVIKGDIIIARDGGVDNYTNHIDTSDRTNYTKTGLQASEPYIRIFVISQVEPIYINASSLLTDAVGHTYEGVATTTIDIDVDNQHNIIKASIIEGSITPNMLTEELSTSITSAIEVTETVGEELSEAETSTLFEEIFS